MIMEPKKIFGIFFSITILFACKDFKNRPEKMDVNVIEKKDSCISKTEKERMIEAILRTPDFQLFLHPKVEGRLPVRLQKNEFITRDLEIKSNDLAVIFEDSLDLPYGSIHRLRITDMDCENKKFSYSIFYPIEGAVITGTVRKADTSWLIVNSNWGIKD